jgi:hypothetical protein
MTQAAMMRPALIAGVLIGILSVLPLFNLVNLFCCAWVIGGGIFASWLYINHSPTRVLLSSGTVLGFFTGAVGALVDVLFSIPLTIMLERRGQGMGAQMEQLAQRLNVPPQVKESLLHFLSSPLFWLINLFFMIIVFGIFGMLGGTLGVALFEKRKPSGPVSYLNHNHTELPPPPPPDPQN